MNSSWSRKAPRAIAETPVPASDPQERSERPSVDGVAVDSHPYLAGEVIGDRYRLVRELGRGGMGVVWVGYALSLGVEVAVKLIRASAASPAIAARMAREAHAAARLGHPALVRVFDFGWTSRGDPYLVMELVQGETLSSALLREGRISAIRAVQMLMPLADGLRLAHDRTIVHRDIKPDNIFLATDPLGRLQPKLLDFGIAKVGPGSVDAKLTQIGVVLGSPEYMSPEQALGMEDVDERTDVWSLSVVLYEMVTGTVPHRKPNYNALMQAIIHEPPQPMTDHAEGDPSLWEVVARGLAKDRQQRWSSMAEFGEALALWLYAHGIKEDICGNSIRAVWIDGPTSTVRIDTISTLAPPIQAASRSEPRFSRTANTIQGIYSRIPGRRYFASTFRRPLAIAAAAVATLVVGVGVGTALLRRNGTTPSVAAELDKVSSAVMPSAIAVVSAALPDHDVPPEDATSRSERKRPIAANEPALDSTSRSQESVTTKQKSAAPTSSKPRASSRMPKKRRDFGF